MSDRNDILSKGWNKNRRIGMNIVTFVMVFAIVLVTLGGIGCIGGGDSGVDSTNTNDGGSSSDPATTSDSLSKETTNLKQNQQNARPIESYLSQAEIQNEGNYIISDVYGKSSWSTSAGLYFTEIGFRNDGIKGVVENKGNDVLKVSTEVLFCVEKDGIAGVSSAHFIFQNEHSSPTKIISLKPGEMANFKTRDLSEIRIQNINLDFLVLRMSNRAY